MTEQIKSFILSDYKKLKLTKESSKKYDALNEKYGKPYKNGYNLQKSCSKWLKQEKRGDSEKLAELGNKSVTINENGTQSSSAIIKMSQQQAKDINYILEAHGYNKDDWEVVTTTNSEWQTQLKGGFIETLYASKITVRPKTKEFSAIDTYKQLLEMPTKHVPIPIKKKENGQLLEIALQDLHIGKMAWGSETGENYDYKIAVARAKSAVSDILERAKKKNIEKILFLLGGDTYHGDNTLMQTTSGTNLDSDLRWQKMFLVGTKLLVELITEMLKFAPVEVVTILGNHSIVTEMHSQMYLSAWFREDKNVKVELEMTPRKYYNYGKCLIGFTHGDKEASRISSVMQIEVPELWGKTKFREIHAGHLHSEQTQEKSGIIIRNISSITGTDSWHVQKGFIGSQQKLQAFLWDKNKGLVEIWNSPILD